MSDNLHQILLRCGYKYTKARHLTDAEPLRLRDPSSGFYVKSYPTTDGEFVVALSLPSDPHITLPNAYILKKPELHKGRLLPHVNMGWYLCYTREKEADWNPNDLDVLYKQIDYQIQKTLDTSISSINQGLPDDREMEGEFSSYWLPKENLYLLSEVDKKREMQCYLTIRQSESENSEKAACHEWVAYEKEDENLFKDWVNQRNLQKVNDKGILTSYFKINPSRLAGVQWPPQNLRDLLQWLSDVDIRALHQLLNHFIKNPVKRHVLLFEVYGQDLVGLFIEINIAATGLTTYSKKNHKKQSKRTIKTKNLISSLSAKRSVQEFIRIDVTKADIKTIISRNRRRSSQGDLSKKRIALIGCGTIGGYLSGLLLRSGAGCEIARFDLYDDDKFGPQNFGRHSLATANIDQNKAEALANTLKRSTHISGSIEAKPIQFPITPKILSEYDIVIDTTGRPPVAKRLAYVVRKLGNNERPILIHGYNDGNGRASKVIIDNGDCCYGCMLANPAFYKNDLDIRFNNINIEEEKFISCGSMFTPYDAAVSVITAAMIQEAVLSTLEPNIRWTYNEHMLDGSRSKRPNYLVRQPNCLICHD